MTGNVTAGAVPQCARRGGAPRLRAGIVARKPAARVTADDVVAGEPYPHSLSEKARKHGFPARTTEEVELVLWQAAKRGRRFVETAHDAEGAYHIDAWPQVRTRQKLPGAAVAAAIPALRVAQRCTLGFLDPVQDALYLLAGLRELGVRASFHLGCETVPATPNAGVFAWVCHRGRVLNTSLPVLETYTEVLRVEAPDTTGRNDRAQYR